MKTLVLALLPFLVPFAAAAATPEVDALIAAARAIPGEFAADALIRIAALDRLDRERRIALLEEAFDRAAGAQQPYKRITGVAGLTGPIGVVNKAYAQELDALSLRLRAVEGMLPLDAAKARGLFDRIAVKLPPATCGDFLVYDVGRYYDVLERVVRIADRAARAAILDRAAAAVASPLQIGGMARALTFAEVPDEGFGTVLETFGKAMGKIAGDDRTFSFARQVGQQIEALTAESKRRNVSPLRMLEGYRVYLVFNLSAARCADALVQAGMLSAFQGPAEPQASELVSHFNQKLQIAPLQPIHELESTPSRFEGTATGPRDCQDPQCGETAGIYRGLMIGPDGTPISQPQRNTPQWEGTLQKVLQSLAGWKETALVTPLELYRERAGAYGSLLNLAPPGASRTLVLRALAQFVAQSPLQKTHRMEWFLAVNGMIARTTLDPAGFGTFSGELQKSANPVIAVYAALESLAPRTPDRILPLL